jgi:hypothetical protein
MMGPQLSRDWIRCIGAYGAGPRSRAAVHENMVPTPSSDEAHFPPARVVIGRADGTHSTVSFHLRAHALVATGTTEDGLCHLLTAHLPEPRLASGDISGRMVSPGQLGHEATATRSGRTQVGGDSGR